MIFQNYSHKDIEPQVLEYWNKNKVVESLRKKTSKGKPFCFLQGPPYTSGKVHLGTAWNTALKDIIVRYKRSRGFNVWDRNGYDVHGLPTEHKVIAKHDLKEKEDIEKFGVDLFIRECEKFSLEMGEQMTKDFQRIGSTLDYTDSYMALKKDYIEGEWWMVKKAWEKDRLYLGDKVITWCGHCETAVAKHECEYKNLNEKSIFVKLRLKDKKDEYLIIWTTTPWTIPYNLAVMVNPDIDYVKIEVEREQWILAKALAGIVLSAVVGKKMAVLEEFKGSKMEGWKYHHPFEKLLPHYANLRKDHPNIHSVILSEEYVDTSAGSGLVHCAPGCGPEDQEAARPYNIPPFNNLTENGYFPVGMNKFSGKRAKVEDEFFIDALDKEGALITTTDVEHEYPHCWRCKNPVIFRKTRQWFFRIEDLRDQMVKENSKVNWIPQTAAFDAWTKNLKDNTITRQRYWGTPVPIWKCDCCESIEVIGSVAELKKKAKKVPDNLHKPWIDEVAWRCSSKNCTNREKDGKTKKIAKSPKKCAGTMRRIPDILDVWIDAGTASWNCLYYPQQQKHFKRFFPPDLILEATEQVRLWFSMLSICSQLGHGKNCYKNVYMHGMIRDINGVKMSKSIGNIITPDEMIEKHGADVLRYYMGQINAGQDIRFSWEEAAIKTRYLLILWNLHKLLINLAKENQANPYSLSSKKVSKNLELEERYILSKLNSTIQKVTELFDQYRLDETVAPLESLYLELSRTYVQMVRDKSSLGSREEKEAVLYTLGEVLLQHLKMFNIISPFISEAIYLNLRDEFGQKYLPEESISHYPWPRCDKKLIDTKLEANLDIAKEVIQSALATREKSQLGLRWPIKEIVVVSRSKENNKALESLKEIVQTQTNSKRLTIIASLPGVKTKIKPDYAKLGPSYGNLTPHIIAKLATESPEMILNHIEEENTYNFTLEGKEIRINKDMLLIEREIPPPFAGSDCRIGQVYLNTERTPELESEGFAREVMRQVQSLRKKAGLEKSQSIKLCLIAGKEMRSRLEPFRKDIKEKVGAETIELLTEKDKKTYAHSSEFKVKEHLFQAMF
jgi:isoleucyl-tRNA synthetase